MSESSQTTELPTSVPWAATGDKSAYIANLWLEAGRRRREAARLIGIVSATLSEADRIETLAKELDAKW